MSNQAENSTQNRVYCSEQQTQLSMAGTADRVDVWLLLEYRDTWTPKVLTEAPLPTEVVAWLGATGEAFAAQGLRLRPQLIRQPEARRSGVQLFLAGGGRLAALDVDDYQDLVQADAVRLWQEAGATDPHYFVCTNGQRDVCCSRFGRPIYAGLRQLVGDRAWQVTHLGGHRYAPNVLVAPENLLYGRVTPVDLDEFVATVEAGKVDFACLRGRTAYPPAVQAAECLLAQQGATLLHVEAGGADNAPTRVQFATASQTYEIEVERSAQVYEILGSCGDDATKPFRPFVRRSTPA